MSSGDRLAGGKGFFAGEPLAILAASSSGPQMGLTGDVMSRVSGGGVSRCILGVTVGLPRCRRRSEGILGSWSVRKSGKVQSPWMSAPSSSGLGKSRTGEEPCRKDSYYKLGAVLADLFC